MLSAKRKTKLTLHLTDRELAAGFEDAEPVVSPPPDAG